ncbi:hypothetical protein EXN66_Car007169 [Channa argus]|uniref:Uncharacterized protein n=1 Tax=Channa argus TaxID=215402 RepID=A0A6G1PMW7_CHAAH|nr:hypothetical protein EXN66_Car007169 [Channa argus]
MAACCVDLAVDEFVLWTRLGERALVMGQTVARHNPASPPENWLASCTDWQAEEEKEELST